MVNPPLLCNGPELDGFDIYTGDGHYLQAASFDPAVDDSKRAVGYFFRLNLRTHLLDYINLERPDPGRKKKHDTKVLKEACPRL